MRTLPWTAAPMVVAPIAGALAGRTGLRALLVTGLSCRPRRWSGSPWLTENGSAYSSFVVPLAMAGVGMGLTFAPSATAVLQGLPDGDFAIASSANSTVREFGVALGIALLVAVFLGNGGEITRPGTTARSARRCSPARPRSPSRSSPRSSPPGRPRTGLTRPDARHAVTRVRRPRDGPASCPRDCPSSGARARLDPAWRVRDSGDGPNGPFPVCQAWPDWTMCADRIACWVSPAGALDRQPPGPGQACGAPCGGGPTTPAYGAAVAAAPPLPRAATHGDQGGHLLGGGVALDHAQERRCSRESASDVALRQAAAVRSRVTVTSPCGSMRARVHVR